MAGAVTLKLLLLSSSPKNLSSKTYPAGYNVAAFQSIVATVLVYSYREVQGFFFEERAQFSLQDLHVGISI